MGLGRLIGAAVACTVITKAAVTIAENRQPKQQNQYNIYNINSSNIYDNEPEITYVKCEYCDSVIELKRGITACCNCGAPLRINQKTQQNPYSSGPNRNSSCDQRQQPQFYSFPCYRCGTKVRYTKADIIRSPRGNKAVAAAGFRGYTGEVRCVKCGTLLPHFESNLDNGW